MKNLELYIVGIYFKEGQYENEKNFTGLIIIFFAILVLYPKMYARATSSNCAQIKNNFKKALIYIPNESYDFAINVSKSSDLKKAKFIDSSTAKNIKVTTSNKNIAKIMPLNDVMSGFRVYPKKAGTTNVTYTAVVKGRKVVIKGKIIIKNFSNPFKSLKINGVEYKNKINKKTIGYLDAGEGCGIYLSSQIKKNKTEVQISYKANKDWKILTKAKGNAFSSSVSEYHNFKNKRRDLVNKGKYSLKGRDDSISMEIYAQNKSTGEIFGVLFFIEHKCKIY